MASYHVRPYRSEDAGGLRDVLVATYGEAAPSQATYDWWAFGCPTAESGFMVAESEGTIAGVQPMEMFAFTDGERTSKGGVLTGVAVHPDFRRRGIFSALISACEEEAWRRGCDFVTTMPNERSRPGFLKLDYCDLGRRRFLARAVDGAGLGKMLAGRMAPLGWCAGKALEASQRLFKTGPRGNNAEVREVRSFDDAVDEVDQAHRRLFPGVRIRRDAAWWRWRYEQSPSRNYRILEARAGNQLMGIAVTVSEERHGTAITYVMDIAMRDTGSAAALLRAVCASAQEAGAQVVASVVSSREMLTLFRKNGFFAAPLWMPIKRFYSVVRFNPARERELPTQWRRIEGWNQTLGDWDNL